MLVAPANAVRSPQASQNPPLVFYRFADCGLVRVRALPLASVDVRQQAPSMYGTRRVAGVS